MIPRPDIICAEQGNTLDEVAELIIQNGHSRIPIYRDNRDHMPRLLSRSATAMAAVMESQSGFL